MIFILFFFFFRRFLIILFWRLSIYYQIVRVNLSFVFIRSVFELFFVKNQFFDLDNVKVLFVFVVVRNVLYIRYIFNDWMIFNQGNYLVFDRVRSLVECLRLDIVCLCCEIDDKIKRIQSDVGKRFGERLGDIQFWKMEV